MTQKIVYSDGIFDLFHRGHVEYLKQCKNIFTNTYLIIGIINDIDSTNYKRTPIYSEDDRYEIIANSKYVDKIVKDAPLIITKDFLDLYKIDYVVHGYANSSDANNQDDFFKIPRELNKFIETKYYDGISSTDIIKKIKLQNN